MCKDSSTLVNTRYASRALAVVTALALAAVLTVPVSVLDTAASTGTGTDDRAVLAVNGSGPPAGTQNTPWG
jgi:hypothetical protein